MAKINKSYAEDLYTENLLLNKDLKEIQEGSFRKEWTWDVLFAPGWITREFKAYTSGSKWSVYRLGLRLSDMKLTLDSNGCWQPTKENFQLSLDRAFSSIMKELNERHYDALQRILNHRFSTLILNLCCGSAKIHGKWFGTLKECWLGDYLLFREIENQGLHTLRLDLRGCTLRDLLRNRGELLSCIAQESLSFHRGFPQENKPSEMEAGFSKIKDRLHQFIHNRENNFLSAREVHTCLPYWLAKIKEDFSWCDGFLFSLRAEILDLSLEEVRSAIKGSTIESFVASYYTGYKKEYYSEFIIQFLNYLL